MNYKITVGKTIFSYQTINIEADSEEEAKQKALQLAKDVVFKDENIQYSVEGIEYHNK